MDHKDGVTQNTRLVLWVLHWYYHCLHTIWYRVCIAVSPITISKCNTELWPGPFFHRHIPELQVL